MCPGVDPAGLEHKVYVSPTVAALPHALPIVFARNAELHVPAWKVGADAPGLYRADKIVCYFATSAAALRAGRQLARALRGVPAQGVPFSGALDGSGIVSRGRDLDGRSWRSMVLRGSRSGAGRRRAERWGWPRPLSGSPRAALDALGRAGLDVVDWHPSVPEPVAGMIDVAERRYLLPPDVETVGGVARGGVDRPAGQPRAGAAGLHRGRRSAGSVPDAGPARRRRDRPLRGHRCRPGDDTG